MKTIITIATIVFFIEKLLKPRLDKADGKYILWYGITNRKFIIL